jgi:hypothetical protein
MSKQYYVESKPGAGGIPGNGQVKTDAKVGLCG